MSSHSNPCAQTHGARLQQAHPVTLPPSCPALRERLWSGPLPWPAGSPFNKAALSCPAGSCGHTKTRQKDDRSQGKFGQSSSFNRHIVPCSRPKDMALWGRAQCYYRHQKVKFTHTHTHTHTHIHTQTHNHEGRDHNGKKCRSPWQHY